MALTKSITLPNGAAGNYIRLSACTWDRTTREASAHLHLFLSSAQAAAAPSNPLCLLAKLRLTGAKFDTYLSHAALEGTTVAAQIYTAALVEPLNPGAGLTSLDLSDAEAA